MQERTHSKVRIHWNFAILAASVFVLGAMQAHAACGDKITVAGGGQISMPSVVTWDANLDEAKQVAQIKKKPFAIYFASKLESKVIGEPYEAVQEYMKANNNTLPNSLTDVPAVVEQAREMGVGNFVKIPVTKENHELVQSLGGEANLMLVCTPAGEKIAAVKCTPDAIKNLDTVRKEIAAWQAKK